jgi:hypothetical protein
MDYRFLCFSYMDYKEVSVLLKIDENFTKISERLQ